MAGYTRTPSLKDNAQMERLVKQNIKEGLDPARNQLLWKSTDLDLVVGHYQEFLVAMAQLGLLLDQSLFVKVLKKFFEGDARLLKEFAQVMGKSLSYCKARSVGISSGAKTHAAVLRVARAWGPAKHSSSESHDTMSQQTGQDTQLAIDDSEPELTICTADEDAAMKALAQAKAMFGGGSSKGLKRNASVCSVASSQGAETKEPEPKEAKKAAGAKVHIC